MTNPEINKKMAEFMGYKEGATKFGSVLTGKCYFNKEHNEWIWSRINNWPVKSPDYCENMTDAMLVVEKMKEKGYVRFHFKKLYDQVFCGFSKNTENSMPVLYQDFGDARTICLATLKTLKIN